MKYGYVIEKMILTNMSINIFLKTEGDAWACQYQHLLTSLENAALGERLSDPVVIDRAADAVPFHVWALLIFSRISIQLYPKSENLV